MSDYMQEAVKEAARAVLNVRRAERDLSPITAEGYLGTGVYDRRRQQEQAAALSAAEPYMRKKWEKELVERIESSDLGAPLHIYPDGTAHIASGPEMRAMLCKFIMDFGRASVRDQILENVEKGAIHE